MGYNPSSFDDEEVIYMGWQTQSNNSDAKVLVSADSPSNRDSEPRTDFLVIDRETGDHSHFSADQYGNVSQWHGYDRK